LHLLPRGGLLGLVALALWLLLLLGLIRLKLVEIVFVLLEVLIVIVFWGGLRWFDYGLWRQLVEELVIKVTVVYG
jgi:hypothetical protein